MNQQEIDALLRSAADMEAERQFVAPLWCWNVLEHAVGRTIGAVVAAQDDLLMGMAMYQRYSKMLNAVIEPLVQAYPDTDQIDDQEFELAVPLPVGVMVSYLSIATAPLDGQPRPAAPRSEDLSSGIDLLWYAAIEMGSQLPSSLLPILKEHLNLDLEPIA